MFFFNDTATTEIYTLSLHDALPIWPDRVRRHRCGGRECRAGPGALRRPDDRARRRHPHVVRDRCDALRGVDRKSTRLNSSHANISYAVFCLKKKNQNYPTTTT